MRRIKRVTIRDVAVRAGVSPTAVSFAFNAPNQLNPDTCQRIRSIASEMNYKANTGVRTRATGKTNTIGLVLPATLHYALEDPFFRLFIREFGFQCDQNRLHLLLLSIGAESTLESLDTIAADGFLAIGVSQEHPFSRVVEQSNRPVILFDSAQTIAAPSFAVDNFRGAYQATQHLLEKGHRQIAVSAKRFTANRIISTPYQRRIDGYRQAIHDAGLSCDALQIVYSDVSAPTGLMGETIDFAEREWQKSTGCPFDAIWSLPQRPTAVLCVNDIRAIQVMRAAQGRGLSIPDDLAVVGFDNIPAAQTTTPSLTTVDQDIKGRAQRAFHLIHGLINEKKKGTLDNASLVDSVQLIVRESS